MESGRKLCVLCCNGFAGGNPGGGGGEEVEADARGLEGLVEFCKLLLLEETPLRGEELWSKRMETLVLNETLRNFKVFLESRKLSVCGGCGAAVESALEIRGRAEEMQKEVKMLQKKLVELSMALGIEMERFYGKMKRIEGTIRGSRGSKLKRHLEGQQGNRVEEDDGRRIDLVRGRILDVVKSLQAERPEGNQQPLLEEVEMEDNPPAPVERCLIKVELDDTEIAEEGPQGEAVLPENPQENNVNAERPEGQIIPEDGANQEEASRMEEPPAEPGSSCGLDETLEIDGGGANNVTEAKRRRKTKAHQKLRSAQKRITKKKTQLKRGRPRKTVNGGQDKVKRGRKKKQADNLVENLNVEDTNGSKAPSAEPPLNEEMPVNLLKLEQNDTQELPPPQLSTTACGIHRKSIKSVKRARFQTVKSAGTKRPRNVPPFSFERASDFTQWYVNRALLQRRGKRKHPLLRYDAEQNKIFVGRVQIIICDTKRTLTCSVCRFTTKAYATAANTPRSLKRGERVIAFHVGTCHEEMLKEEEEKGWNEH